MHGEELIRNALRNNPTPENIAVARELGIILKPKRQKPVRLDSRWASEDEFTRAVVQHTNARFPHLLAFHVANENAHRRPGIAGGMPDVIVIAEHGVMFIELKVTRADGSVGELRPTQVMMIDKLRAMGCRVEVVTDDLDECIRIVGEWDNENQTRP